MLHIKKSTSEVQKGTSGTRQEGTTRAEALEVQS